MRLLRALRLGLVLVAAGCRPAAARPAARAETRAEEVARLQQESDAYYARERAWAFEAPACDLPAPVDTAGWRLASARGRALDFSLPPDFVEDTVVRFWHGGVQWRGAGGRSFARIGGHWGPGSFRKGRESLERCWAVVGGTRMLVVTRRSAVAAELHAWPADQFGDAGYILSGQAPRPADLGMLWTILLTMPGTRAAEPR